MSPGCSRRKRARHLRDRLRSLCCSQADSATTDAIASATRGEQARIRSFMAASLCTVGQRKFRSILNEVGVRANTSVTSITSFVPTRAGGIYLAETIRRCRCGSKKSRDALGAVYHADLVRRPQLGSGTACWDTGQKAARAPSHDRKDRLPPASGEARPSRLASPTTSSHRRALGGTTPTTATSDPRACPAATMTCAPLAVSTCIAGCRAPNSHRRSISPSQWLRSGGPAAFRSSSLSATSRWNASCVGCATGLRSSHG